MIKTELELRFIVDITKPMTDSERDILFDALEAAEDLRAFHGQPTSPDIQRVRALVGQPDSSASLPTVRDVGASLVREALLKHHGNRTHAAKEIGLRRRTLCQWIKRYDIHVDSGPCNCVVGSRRVLAQ